MLRFVQFLLESRVDFVKDMYTKKGVNTSHDPTAVHTDPGAIVDHFAQNADPSEKKVHTQWIMNKYNRGDFRQENHPRVRAALTQFDRYKSRLERKDINQYNSLGDLETAIAPMTGPASNKEAKRQAKDEGAELVHNQDGVTVHHIKTKEASCQYGSGTRWCTAATSGENRFDTYNRLGPLYVIQHKGRKFQFHFPNKQDYGYDYRPMLANEKDDSINMAEMPEAIRSSLAKSTHPDIQRANLHFGNDKMSSDKIDELSRVADINVRHRALSHPALSKKRMDEVVMGEEMGQERTDDVNALLDNPNLSTEHLSHIYGHREVSLPMKRKIVTHPNVGYDVIDKAIAGGNERLLMSVASNPKLKPEHITALLNSASPDVRASASQHPNANSAHIKYLIDNDENPYVRISAAYNKNIDDDTLLKAAMDRDSSVRDAARFNPKFGPKHINKMIDIVAAKKGDHTHEDILTIGAVLSDIGKATPENFSHAIATKEPQLVETVAGNPHRTKEHENQIMSLPDDIKFGRAKQTLLNSGSASKETFAKALAHENDEVTRVTAAIGTRHPEQIMQALKHPDEETRYAATLNRHATPEHWAVAAQDSSPLVSNLAKKKLERVAAS